MYHVEGSHAAAEGGTCALDRACDVSLAPPVKSRSQFLSVRYCSESLLTEEISCLQKDIIQRDIAERDIAERDIAERDIAERYCSERYIAERHCSESKMMAYIEEAQVKSTAG